MDLIENVRMANCVITNKLVMLNITTFPDLIHQFVEETKIGCNHI